MVSIHSDRSSTIILSAFRYRQRWLHRSVWDRRDGQGTFLWWKTQNVVYILFWRVFSLISFSMFSVCWAVAVMNSNPLNCSNTSSVHVIAMNKALLPKTILFALSRKMNFSVSSCLLLLNWHVHSSSMQQVSQKTIASYSCLHVPVIVHLSLNMCACVCLSNVFLFSETNQGNVHQPRKKISAVSDNKSHLFSSFCTLSTRRGSDREQKAWDWKEKSSWIATRDRLFVA